MGTPTKGTSPFQARVIHSHPPPTLLLPPHGDEPITEREKPKKNIHRGVCPGKNMCCIVLRVAVPSPELVADNSFSSFSADTVTENHFIDSFAPGVLNAFNIPSPPTEDDAQNQHLGYLGGGGGAQQAGGVNQQPEAVAAVANEGLWNE